jgi:hypothetical protein
VIPQPFHQSAHRTVHTSWTLSSKDTTEWGQDALFKVLIPEVHGVLNQQSDQKPWWSWPSYHLIKPLQTPAHVPSLKWHSKLICLTF